MFRVPSRSTFPGTVASPPRLTYGSRRQLVGVMHGRNGWSPNGRVVAPADPAHAITEPTFRAPWGELEREIPYVTITTRLFPLEWWTAPGLRTGATATATALPVDLLTPAALIAEPELRAPSSVAPSQASMPAAELESHPVEVHATEHIAPAREPRYEPRLAIPNRETPLAARRAPGANRRAAQAHRGLVARLLIVAVGLVISLIAVETATRRRV